jgi:FAD/FMN-containing dehydrogenase/pimeloyl-ACP methyl ester carboxylesterase
MKAVVARRSFALRLPASDEGANMATQPATTTHADRERLLAGIPVSERRVAAAGVWTALLEGGEGPPVVLLHGPAGNGAHWLRVIPHLVGTNRVIAPDLPGHGASVTADGIELDADRVLDWLGELIESTCAEPPVVVGHAVGGSIGARLAARDGGRLSRLVLVDSFGLTDLEPAPEFGLAIHAFLTGPSEDTHDSLWQYCAYDVDRVQRSMGERWEPFRAYNVERARSPRVLAAVDALMEQFGAPAIPAEELAAISVPTTLIWGRHDLATPLAVAEDAGARYRWPLHVIEDVADDPPVEQPEELVRALRSALGADGQGIRLTDAQRLAAAGFNGEIVDRGHPSYDELRAVFNGMVDRRPVLIARCLDAHDVSAAVGFARERGLPVSVYGGGHNVTGNAVCDDGVTIDLRPMKGIEIDAAGRTCRAAAGLTWGELDAATQEHGLAVTGGRVSTTGISGLILGGGSGWIERKFGLAVDNLLSVETVTADGSILTASETENAELFWGARGGGGNFGVTTSFELGLHPVGPSLLGGMLVYPAEMASEVLRNFRDVMAMAPDEVGAGISLLTAPSEDPVPEPVRGQPVVGVVACYVGPVEEGEDALRPLREFGPPALDMVEPMPYVALQTLFDADYPKGLRNYWTGDFLSGLPDEAIEVLCRHHQSMPSARSEVLLFPGGGAMSRVPDGTTALTEREAPFNVHITSVWDEPADDEANIAWTRELSAALKPFTTGRVYVNFIGDEGRDRVVASFGPEVYARLQQLKRRHDPDNMFRTSQNVLPA